MGVKSLENKHIKAIQKCWDCIHAVPGRTSGCEWSEEGKPVEGWKARPTTIKASKRAIVDEYPSFQIDDCPKFEKGKTGAEALITDYQTGQDLAFAVIKQAVADWRSLCKGNFDEWDCNFDELTLFFTREASFYIGSSAAKALWEGMQKERMEAGLWD